MAMAMATVMMEQRGQVGWGHCGDKFDASTKAKTTRTAARMLTTKENDWNLIPPGDAAQRNRLRDGAGGVQHGI